MSTTMTTVKASLAAALVLGSLSAASLPAGAEPTSPDEVRAEHAADALRHVQERAARAISLRIDELGDAIERAGTSTSLTEAHRTALVDQYESYITGLEDLGATIAADTELAVAREHAHHIVWDYWIFALQIPKLPISRSADSVPIAADALRSAADHIDAAAETLEQQGHDVSAVLDLTAQVRSYADTAAAGVAGVADEVIALSAADHPENHDQLVAGRDAVHDAYGNLKTGRDLAGQALDTLRDIASTPAAASTA